MVDKMAQREFVVKIQYKKIEFKKPEYYLSRLREVTRELYISFPEQDEKLKVNGFQGIGTFIELKGIYSGNLSQTDLLQALEQRLEENKLFPTTQNVRYKKIEFLSFQDYCNQDRYENTQQPVKYRSDRQDYKLTDSQFQLSQARKQSEIEKPKLSNQIESSNNINFSNSQTHDIKQKRQIENQQLNNNKDINPDNNTSKNLNLDDTKYSKNFQQGYLQLTDTLFATNCLQQQICLSKVEIGEVENQCSEKINNSNQQDLSQLKYQINHSQADKNSVQQIHQDKKGDEKVKNEENNQVKKSDVYDQINSFRQNSLQKESKREIEISDKQDLTNTSNQSYSNKKENQQLNKNQVLFQSNNFDDGDQKLQQLAQPIQDLKEKSKEEMIEIVQNIQSQIQLILNNNLIIIK